MVFIRYGNSPDEKGRQGEYTMIKWIAGLVLLLAAAPSVLGQTKTWTFNYRPYCVLRAERLPVDIFTNGNVWFSGQGWVKPRMRIYTGSPPSGYSDIGQAPFAWRYWPGIDYTGNLAEGGDRARMYLSYFRFINLDDNLWYVPLAGENPAYNTSSATVTFGDHYIDIHSDFFFTNKRWRVEWIPPPPGSMLDFGMLPSNFISYERGVTYNGQRGLWSATMRSLSNVVCDTAGTIPEEPFLLTQSFYYTPATSAKRRVVLDFNRAVTSCSGSGGNLPAGAVILHLVKSINSIRLSPGPGPYTCMGCTGTFGTTWSIENGVNAATDCLDPSTVATTRYLPTVQLIDMQTLSDATICAFPTSLGYPVLYGLDQTDVTQGVGDGIDAQGRAFLVQWSVLRSPRRMGHFFNPSTRRLAHIVTNLPVPIDDSATSQSWPAAGYHPNDNFASIIEVPSGSNWTSSIVGASAVVRVFTARSLGRVDIFPPLSPVFDMDFTFLPASIASLEPEVMTVAGVAQIVYKVTTTTFFPRGNVFVFSAQATPATPLAYTCPECSETRYLDYRYLIPSTPIINISVPMCVQFSSVLVKGTFVGDQICASRANQPFGATRAVILDFIVSGSFWGFLTRIYFNNTAPFTYFAGLYGITAQCNGDVVANFGGQIHPRLYPWNCPYPHTAEISGPNSVDIRIRPLDQIWPGVISLTRGLLLSAGGESVAQSIYPAYALPVTYEFPTGMFTRGTGYPRFKLFVKFQSAPLVSIRNNGAFTSCTSLECAYSITSLQCNTASSNAIISPTDPFLFTVGSTSACTHDGRRAFLVTDSVPFAFIFQEMIHGGWNYPYQIYFYEGFPPEVTDVTCDGGNVAFIFNGDIGVANGTSVPFVCDGATYQGAIVGFDTRSVTVKAPSGALEKTCAITVTVRNYWFGSVSFTRALLVCTDKLFAPLQAVMYPTRLFVQFAPISGFIPSSVNPAKWVFECLNETSTVEYVTITDDLTWMELAIPLCLRPPDNDTTYFGSLRLLDGAFATEFGGEINSSAMIHVLYSDELVYYSDCTTLPNGECTTTFTIFGIWEFVSAVDREPCNRKEVRVTDRTIVFTVAASRYETCGSYVTLRGVGNREFVLELVYGGCDRIPLKYDTIYRYTPALNYDISKSLAYYEKDITYVTDDSNSGFGPIEWKKGIVSYNRYSLGLNFTGQFDCTYFFGPSVTTAISKGTADKVMDTWFNPSKDVLQYSVEVWARPDLRAGNNWLLAFSSEILASTNGGGSRGCSDAKYSSGIWARSVAGGAQIVPLLGSINYYGQVSCSDNRYDRVYSTEGFYTETEIPDIEHVGAYPYLSGSTTTEVFQGVLTVYAQKIEPPGPYYSRYYNYTIRYVYWSKSGRKEFLSSGIAGTQAVCQQPTRFCVTKGETYEYIPFKNSASRVILAPVYTPYLDPSERGKWCPDVLPSFHPAFRPYGYSPQMFTGQLYQTAMYGRALSDAEIDDLWQTGLPNSRPAARATFIRILEDTSANLNVSLDLYDFDIMELGRTDQTLQVLSLTLKSGRGSLVSNVSNDTVFFVPEFCTFGENYAEVAVTLFDGIDVSREWVVPIHVTHVNHAPIPANVSAKVILDRNSTVTVSGVDCDQGDSVVAMVLLEPPTEGTVYHPVTGLPITAYPVQFPGDTFYYLPATVETVPDQYDTIAYAYIPFLVTDSQGLNSTAPAWIQLNISNNVQAGTPPTLRVPEDTLVSFDITSGFDAQGYPVRYKIMTLPVNGTLYQDSVPVEFALLPFAVTGQLQYQGLADQTGPDSFTFIAESTNTSRQSSRGTFHISITPFNDPPSISEPFGAKFGYTLAPAALRAQVTLDLFDVDSEENAYDIEIRCSRGIQLELGQEAKWLYGNWSVVDPGRNNVRQGDYLAGNPRFTASFSKPVLLGGLLRNFTLECGTVEKHEIQFTLTDNTGLSDRKSATRTLEFECFDGTALFGSTTGSSLLGTVVLLSWIGLAVILSSCVFFMCIWPYCLKPYFRKQATVAHKATGVASGRLSILDILRGKTDKPTKARHSTHAEEEEEEKQSLL